MNGPGDAGDGQVPDYAGKDGGHAGGPGGHARERLDELISQRLPGSGEVPDGQPEADGDERPDDETLLDEDTTEQDSADEGTTDEDSTGGDDPGARSDEAEQEGTGP